MKSLTDYAVIKDSSLRRKYENSRIPMATLYEAYFDGDIDLPDDHKLYEMLGNRDLFVNYNVTPKLLKWAATNMIPERFIHSQEQDTRIVREHYDRGNDFFEWFLGERMVYTSGYFENEEMSVEKAQDCKFNLVCQKLQLEKGESLLDIGCGWGTLAAHAATHYGVDATGVTLAKEQTQFANARFEKWDIADRARVLRKLRGQPSHPPVVCIADRRRPDARDEPPAEARDLVLQPRHDGAPAGDGFHGAPGVHTHMTNSRLTDPEVLEWRYPVLLEHFGIRRGSGGLHGILVHAPDIAHELDLGADGVARPQHRDVGARRIAEIGVVGAAVLQRQALRRVIAGGQGELDGRQHFEAQLLRQFLACFLRRGGVGVVGAHVDVFGFARTTLRLPVLESPLQHGAQ